MTAETKKVKRDHGIITERGIAGYKYFKEESWKNGRVNWGAGRELIHTERERKREMVMFEKS